MTNIVKGKMYLYIVSNNSHAYLIYLFR